MGSVLIVSTSDEDSRAINALILREGHFNISTAVSGSQARRMVLEEDWDVVVVDSPMRDDDAESFLRMLSEHSDASAILLVKPEYAALLGKRLEGTGTLMMEKPIQTGLFHQVFRLSLSLRSRLEGLKAANARLQAQLEDQKFIAQAKISLIINEHMTEEEAHRYIEKASMDRRISRREVAKAILRIQAGK